MAITSAQRAALEAASGSGLAVRPTLSLASTLDASGEVVTNEWAGSGDVSAKTYSWHTLEAYDATATYGAVDDTEYAAGAYAEVDKVSGLVVVFGGSTCTGGYVVLNAGSAAVGKANLQSYSGVNTAATYKKRWTVPPNTRVLIPYSEWITDFYVTALGMDNADITVEPF